MKYKVTVEVLNVEYQREYDVTIRKYCGARHGIHGLTCELTFGNHTISEYLQYDSKAGPKEILERISEAVIAEPAIPCQGAA